MLAHVLETNAEGGKAVVERTYVDAEIKEDWLLFNSLAFAAQLGLAGS